MPPLTAGPNAARWRAFMAEAALSVALAQTAPTRRLKRMWLEQASDEMDRAWEALRAR